MRSEEWAWRSPSDETRWLATSGYGPERRVVSAKVLELPARVRCDRAARELREGVIGVLKEIRLGGDAAFVDGRNKLVRALVSFFALFYFVV